MFYPERRILATPAQAGLEFEDLAIESGDGEWLHGWWVPARGGRARAHVLVCHGNAGNVGDRVLHAALLTRAGFDVLLFDYRGYGGNPGSPSEQGLALDVRAARAFLAGSGVPAERIVYFGESLGTAVVVELATEDPPAAMLLRSPFVDLASLGRVHYPFLPVRSLLRDRFPLVENLAEVVVPVTVVYGSEDSIVPPDQSLAVAEAARNLRRLVEVDGADHNDMALLDGADLVDAVVDLAEHIAPPRPPD